MLLTKREEQLLKAFLEFGKLSIDNISDILKVSKRTVYRTIADLTDSLATLDVDIVKEENKYQLLGNLENLSDFTTQVAYTRNERLNLITYQLLISDEEVTNDDLQEQFAVSNVTIIQDIADIEKRLKDFDLILERKKGYFLSSPTHNKRRVLAILLTNNISLPNFWKHDYNHFTIVSSEQLKQATEVFQRYQKELPEFDAKLTQFFIILLALTNWGQVELRSTPVTKVSLEFSQKVFADFSRMSGQFYSLKEILYYAEMVDKLAVKRQETPLFNEKFDSEFFYNISNLIDKVARYTKINFAKDQVLFKFLFNHIRLNLAVPLIFEESNSTSIAHQTLHSNEYLHRVVSLLVKEIFPAYLQSEREYELITLHFASSLRRSPDIYPISLLLLTDERPLATELLVTRIKTIAPFVETIQVKASSQYDAKDKEYYDSVLSTKVLRDDDIKMISIYPDAKELLTLQEYLQNVQAHREVRVREQIIRTPQYDFQKYLLASQMLLSRFVYQHIDNPKSFVETVPTLIDNIEGITDKNHLSQKLLQRFKTSPMAIPETNLALLHTYSSKVTKSCFVIFELENPVPAMSMNHQEEEISRVLVMLTRLNESDEVRDLMTAISQSIIENHLYTEIYKTGNKDIIYQLLNQIFTEKIKKLEN